MKENQSHSEVSRKRFSSDQKFKIVKEHLTAKTPVSELCKKYGMTSKSYYTWQEKFFSAALKGFDVKRGPQPKADQNNEKIEAQQAEIERMREVIAEITSENIAFKKKNLVLYR